MTDVYVLMHAELFHGNTTVSTPEEETFASDQEAFDHVLEDMRMWIEDGLEGDTISGLPASSTVATSGCGIAIRDSYEHALIWFRKPQGFISFHEHQGLLFSISEYQYQTAVHLWPSMLTFRSNGIHCFPDQSVHLLMGSADVIGTHFSPDRAIEATQRDIEQLYAPIMHGVGPAVTP